MSMKWSLVSIEYLDPNSEKKEGIYKADIFIYYIAFGASLLVFCDLNAFSKCNLAVEFFSGESCF